MKAALTAVAPHRLVLDQMLALVAFGELEYLGGVERACKSTITASGSPVGSCSLARWVRHHCNHSRSVSPSMCRCSSHFGSDWTNAAAGSGDAAAPVSALPLSLPADEEDANLAVVAAADMVAGMRFGCGPEATSPVAASVTQLASAGHDFTGTRVRSSHK